ncbi:MAG: glycosyltransferase family 2 protein [Planctomycetota bacterium]
MSPKVSVIIPAYGHAGVIGQTLDSVLAQSFQDFEIVIVNDGSPDDTAGAVADYLSDERVRYVEQPNGGQASARNHGLRLARGVYLAYLDDDDLWPTDKLAWQVELLDQHPDAGFVYGCQVCFFPDGREAEDHTKGRSGDLYERMLDHCFIKSPGQVLFRADAVRAAGGWDESIRGSDDWDLYLRMLKSSTCVGSRRVALRYRLHGTNASHNGWVMAKSCRRVLVKHLGLWPKRQPLRWARRWVWHSRFWGQRIHDQARAAARSGDRRAAFRQTVLAVRADPLSLFRPATVKTLGTLVAGSSQRSADAADTPATGSGSTVVASAGGDRRDG